ncbi:MAG TPA: ABC transporter permease [Anaerolineae bacterium]|nr:ABC transporter permease [Anaerolineae bacterium]
MSLDLIWTLVCKDIVLYFRNPFFAFVTVIGVVAYVAIYFVMPDSVDERLDIGLYGPSLPAALAAEFEEGGIVFHRKESTRDLRQGIVSDEYEVGVFWPDLGAAVANDEPVVVELIFANDFPTDMREAYQLMFQEIALGVLGQPLLIEATEEVLGPDMAGQQIPLRERLVPLMVIFILMTEMLGVASLISGEVEAGTIRALLVTPLRVEGFFVAKAVMSVGLAFGQAMIILVAVGGVGERPLPLIATILCGAILVTGIGFMVGSVARDMMSVMAWGMVFMIVLSIPLTTLLMPGLLGPWIQVLPTYYLADTMHQLSNFEAGWSDVSGNLLILLVYSVVFLGVGMVALRRKFQ